MVAIAVTLRYVRHRMAIFVINSGSSSIKFALYDDGASHILAHGIVEQVTTPDAHGKLTAPDGRKRDIVLADSACDHAGALEGILHAIDATPSLQQESVSAVGHRVVHGGELFPEPCLIDDSVVAGIKELAGLAPLHNGPNAVGIDAARGIFPDAPNVAVFDTAFHQTIAPEVYHYAVPRQLYRDHAVRRYGFHGTSHRYVSQTAVGRLGLAADDHRVLVAHLGNGCSATAVRNGASVDTSMGITPLEGLVMGTRSGNVDPNLHGYLARKTGWSLDRITELLNKQSGLLGLSGRSNDMRELTRLYHEGDRDAVLAIDVFCFRLARELAGLSVALEGRPDALVFTGGIGENSVLVREKTTRHLAAMGCQLEAQANASHGSETNGVISAPGSAVTVAVVATDEELAIAKITRKLAF